VTLSGDVHEPSHLRHEPSRGFARATARVIDLEGALAAAGASVALLAGLVFALAAVVSRYRIGRDIPIALPDEAARGMLGWLTFLGAVAAMRDGRHLRFELVDALLPRSVLAARNIVFDIAMFAVQIYVAKLGWSVFQSDRHASLASVSAPKAIFSGAIMFGFGAQAIFSLLLLGRHAATLRGGVRARRALTDQEEIA
jgi:TRAP-type transport system small permease protein